MPQFQIIPENPSFGSQFGQTLGQGISQGISDKLTEFGKDQKIKAREKDFLKQGYPEDLAKLASLATTGGETEVLKTLLDMRARGSLNQEQLPKSTHIEEEIESPEGEFDREIKTLKSEDVGLTPRERSQRESENYKAGLPLYQEATTKLRNFSRDRERTDILESLNRSDKLPKDFGRLNVDEKGNLRFPFVGSPEAQRYVKTLNEFSSGAKDTFGSRVTNFDLQQYLQRFPTLLNSKEGRRQLLDQMKIVNEINSVYYRSLKNVYDKAGGARKIDADRAEYLAEKVSEKKVEELRNKFDEIGQFSSLPSPEQFKGRKIQDEDTGEILQSNGKEWIPVK